MEFPEFSALMKANHQPVYRPGARELASPGWHVIATPSCYHPEGWTLRIDKPSWVITKYLDHLLRRLGFEVQVDPMDAVIEIWPAPVAPS